MIILILGLKEEIISITVGVIFITIRSLLFIIWSILAWIIKFTLPIFNKIQNQIPSSLQQKVRQQYRTKPHIKIQNQNRNKNKIKIVQDSLKFPPGDFGQKNTVKNLDKKRRQSCHQSKKKTSKQIITIIFMIFLITKCLLQFTISTLLLIIGPISINIVNFLAFSNYIFIFIVVFINLKMIKNVNQQSPSLKVKTLQKDQMKMVKQQIKVQQKEQDGSSNVSINIKKQNLDSSPTSIVESYTKKMEFKQPLPIVCQQNEDKQNTKKKSLLKSRSAKIIKQSQTKKVQIGKCIQYFQYQQSENKLDFDGSIKLLYRNKQIQTRSKISQLILEQELLKMKKKRDDNLTSFKNLK